MNLREIISVHLEGALLTPVPQQKPPPGMLTAVITPQHMEQNHEQGPPQ